MINIIPNYIIDSNNESSLDKGFNHNGGPSVLIYKLIFLRRANKPKARTFIIKYEAVHINV